MITPSVRSFTRDETSFPAMSRSTTSSLSDERMGAFGQMQLNPITNQQESRPSSLKKPRPPIVPNDYLLEGNGYERPNSSQGVGGGGIGYIQRPNHLSVNYADERSPVIYQPTTSNVGSYDSRKKYEKLSEVYSTSGDTVEFARNLGEYLNEKIPYGLSISILIFLSIVAFILILVGALNLPFCDVQPMIPIWLIIIGALFIISSTFRIYALIPSPSKTITRRRTLSSDLLCKVIELLFVLASIVWLILGCVWVYGTKSYVHFEEGMFEEHYCDATLYWIAFATCTSYLLGICLIVVILICILAVGSYKETGPADMLEP